MLAVLQDLREWLGFDLALPRPRNLVASPLKIKGLAKVTVDVHGGHLFEVRGHIPRLSASAS